MDIEHFQIIVNAMLSWQDEAHAPKKAPSRPALAARPRNELDDDDDDDEEFVDDDFEPEESLQIKPEPEPADGDAADADLSEID